MEPNPGQPQLVIPKPGTLNPHPVAVERLEATVDGRNVTVVATWTSGVEPCNILDSVGVKQDGNELTINVTEGSANRDAMCIEIAVQKATLIELGELAPGDYTVAAQPGTPPRILFTVA